MAAETWLNSATLLARYNMAWSLVGGENPSFRQKINPAALARKHAGNNPVHQVAFLLDLFVQTDATGSVRKKLIDYLAAGAADDPNGACEK